MYPHVISLGIYSLTRQGWENPKPRFWHFEPWFWKVLEIFENTLLYITANSFGSGGEGGGEGFYIRLRCGGRGMRFDRHSFPSDGCDALWRLGPGLYTWSVRKPWWSPAVSPTSPSPTPQNPRHRQTNRLTELIYKIYSNFNRYWSFIVLCILFLYARFEAFCDVKNYIFIRVKWFYPFILIKSCQKKLGQPSCAPRFHLVTEIRWKYIKSTNHLMIM